MEQEKIDRISYLSRKARTPEGLTAAEQQERAALRQEYVRAVVGSLDAQLSNTYVLDGLGNKRKLRKKEEQDR